MLSTCHLMVHLKHGNPEIFAYVLHSFANDKIPCVDSLNFFDMDGCQQDDYCEIFGAIIPFRGVDR